MKQKSQTINAKQFLHGVNLIEIQQTLSCINFNTREKNVLQLMLQDKTIKEMSIELNYSLSYIAAIKQEIYSKISVFLSE